MKYTLLPLIALVANITAGRANFISATPANYLSFLGTLAPGDTLMLEAGTYTRSLALNGINGTAGKPIAIMGRGDATVLQGESCCNTIDITHCSWLIISSMRLDGKNLYIDAVKGAGTAGNWAHHITVEYLTIVNYGADQQNVGISTKCPAWNWVIRKNRILGAGTGMYLGNSDGTQPFVNGLIECNLIANTVGYNIEIKHQFNGTRDAYPGTALNGKTIIRRNVFTKDNSSSTGGNARPNLLVGGFPATGWGSADYYEIYGNFFYNNPVEALFQGTGNVMLYDNIFVNHFDPSGFRALYITPQNGVAPQDIKVFHNTIWAANTAGGIRLYNPNTAYRQYCYANAVFAPSPIANFTDAKDNVTDSYANAGLYLLSASTDIGKLDLYPRAGKLTGAVTPDTLFRSYTDRERDFNFDPYDWSFRGAYAGSGTNRGWQLRVDTMPGVPASFLELIIGSTTIGATAGSTASFGINSNTAWSVASDQSWLTPAPASGTGSSRVTLTAEENPASAPRSATVTVSGNGVSSETFGAIQEGVATGIRDLRETPSGEFLRAGPNPFSGRSVISFALERSRDVSLSVSDSFGKEVIRLLENRFLEAGQHRFPIDATMLKPGVYFCRMTTGAGGRTAKFVIVK